MENCTAASTPVITVRRVQGEYRIDAPWLEEPVFADTSVCAFSSIVVDLIYAWLEAGSSAFCLHCAAVECNGRLIVFPNTNKVGKSLLAVRMMAEAHACYGDDLMACTAEGEGMSFGVPPRLRLPLPASETKVAEFVRSYGGKADTRSRYMAPDAPRLAPFGRTLPIGAFVMLLRTEEEAAELVPADFSESLRNLVHQNFMRSGSALDVLELSQRLTEEKPCWYLRYARLDDAVALLRKAFLETDKGFSAKRENTGPPLSSAEKVKSMPCLPRARSPRRRVSHKNYVRRSDVLLRQGQGECFLIQESGDAIFHLNALGRAVWELLAEPLSEAEAAALISSVFQDIPQSQIEHDVIRLFSALTKEKLVLCV